MSHGKEICNYLKSIRKQIAKENDISLDIPECTYQGDCKGTCPRCESEMRYLEKELARRSRLGKEAIVAGIAVTLSAMAASCDEPLQGDVVLSTDTNILTQDTSVSKLISEENIDGNSLYPTTKMQSKYTATNQVMAHQLKIKEDTIALKDDKGEGVFGTMGLVPAVIEGEEVPDSEIVDMQNLPSITIQSKNGVGTITDLQGTPLKKKNSTDVQP